VFLLALYQLTTVSMLLAHIFTGQLMLKLLVDIQRHLFQIEKEDMIIFNILMREVEVTLLQYIQIECTLK